MKIATRVLWGLASAGLAAYVGLTLWLALRALAFPYALDYGEGIVVWFTHKIAQGQNLYAPLQGPPFDVANYPPVAFLLTAALSFIVNDALAVGRGLNLAAAVLVTTFIAQWIRRETHNTRAALLGAGIFLGSTFVYHWLPLFRVDMLGLAFSFAGIFYVWKWEEERRAESGERRETRTAKRGARGFGANWYLALATGLFLVALYTKHSLFFAPVAAAVAIFLRDKRAAIFFALGLGLSGGAIFLVMERLTQGGWSFGIIALNATVWTPRVFFPLLSSFLITYAVVLLLAVYSWWTRVRAKKISVLEMYAAAALASVALAGREGAWENYFLEVIGMACVFGGFAIAKLLENPKPLFQIALPLLLLAQLALFWNEHDPRIAEKLFDEVRAGNEQLAPLIQNARGTVIAEDTGLLWANGKAVEYYSFPFSTLARAGRYDQKWEIENLRAGNFPLVILYRGTRADVDAFGNFTRAFVSGLDYGYAPIYSDARYTVYAPAPLEHLEPRAVFGETFELVGWTLTPSELRAGSEMELSVVWRALQKPSARYTLFAQLAERDGGNVAQDDHEPHSGNYPTARWADGEMVRETFHLRVPSNLKNGGYVLRIGWYDTLTQERLSLADGVEELVLANFWLIE